MPDIASRQRGNVQQAAGRAQRAEHGAGIAAALEGEQHLPQARKGTPDAAAGQLVYGSGRDVGKGKGGEGGGGGEGGDDGDKGELHGMYARRAEAACDLLPLGRSGGAVV
eukprot:jgi/Ulvmu1/4945/UM205_0007.1